MLFRNFASQDEIDREYNAVLSVSNLMDYIERDSKANESARKELNCVLACSYGQDA